MYVILNFNVYLRDIYIIRVLFYLVGIFTKVLQHIYRGLRMVR